MSRGVKGTVNKQVTSNGPVVRTPREELLKPVSCGQLGEVLGGQLSSRAGRTVIEFRFNFALNDDHLRALRQEALRISGCADVAKTKSSRSVTYIELAFHPGTKSTTCYSSAVLFRTRATDWLTNNPNGSETAKKRAQRQTSRDEHDKGQRLPVPSTPFMKA
jgi:hypothetical protein